MPNKWVWASNVGGRANLADSIPGWLGLTQNSGLRPAAPPLAVINKTLQGCAGVALDALDHGMHTIGPLRRQMRRKAQSFEEALSIGS